MASDDLIKKLKAALGDAGVLTGKDAEEKAVGGWSKLGVPAAVLRPASTEEVSAALKLCHAAGEAVVPWGGKTGLVEGGEADGHIALSLERMNRIEEVDTLGGTMTVQAGCVLQTVCEAAEEKGLIFPLDLGARGSATIGGNISTNAGGNRVIRYGMMRDMVLGLEAVLADGTVMTSMNKLIKNNAGYDLKQIFIGSEGTLGVVTRAVLRVWPKPLSQDTGFVAVDSFEALPKFLRHMERALGGTLSAFEVMWEDFYKLVTIEPAKGKPVIDHGHPYYVLVESMGGDQEADSARFEAAMMEALEAGEISDAVIAKSQAERDAMWALRDDVGQVVHTYPMFTFDVSLKLADMESYVAEVKKGLAAKWPESSLMVFGHLGDGNLHVIPGRFPDASKETRRGVEAIVYGELRDRQGSVSAEHGIGLEKRPYLDWSRSAEEVALMHLLKRTLDPKNILNPGKVLEPAAKAKAAE
ncbi:FAD-binding oxidoreductase [Parvibaculum sp.]|uniref:FAD-binding oxidoreductase n=1 Tax=Parvibaculum sp. TaxID=2024848 RepID=UPI001B196BDC|nr:FAD-binding oxidoreductase [Parvibaculum sp.]MBO6633987.1 FAD-binding oxidoreductase [Parvibaculum sp.]MBO6680043.1 FAD-binding oxidoreductase [Parvibaculum sp.]MBO6683628.1 FAD-binding oxidoreductase [Parvibaculum sp.]MBO6904768.1 FAD-binding oxidoreductase [Parvibaculum sp.]